MLLAQASDNRPEWEKVSLLKLLTLKHMELCIACLDGEEGPKEEIALLESEMFDFIQSRLISIHVSVLPEELLTYPLNSFTDHYNDNPNFS